MRESFERAFVKHLQAAGVEAVSSPEAIAMPTDLELEKDVILKAVDKYGNDAVFSTHLTGIEEKEVFTRTGRISSGYYTYHGYVYDYVHDTGFYSGIKTVRLETNLYDVETEKLLWSGQSETKDLKSIKQLIDEVIALVVTDLRKHKLLPSP